MRWLIFSSEKRHIAGILVVFMYIRNGKNICFSSSSVLAFSIAFYIEFLTEIDATAVCQMIHIFHKMLLISDFEHSV